MLKARRSRRQRVTSVPGQYLGYSLQCSRMLDHLLRAKPGDCVSLEVIGDVATVSPDGSTVAEEGKSRTGGGNPISDRAIDFWKAIRNWADAVQAGQLEPSRTKFRLYTSRPFESNIAERFTRASTRIAAKQELDAARSDLWSSVERVADGPLSGHLRAVFSADPELITAIIERFEIESGTGSSIDDMRLVLQKMLVPSELLDHVLRSMLGWLKMLTDSQIERGQPATVEYDEFHREMLALTRKLDHQQFLASVASEPSKKRVREHLRLRTYVRQLDLIEVDDDEKIRAVIDFMKAEADRIHWAAKGRVHSTSFDEFEIDLISAWRNYRRRCGVLAKAYGAAEQGKLLYADCGLHAPKLQGIELPAHFCRGSFHALADVLKIGWHPEYSILLRGTRRRDGDAK